MNRYYVKHQTYESNVGILKYYTDEIYKLINVKTLKIAGFESVSYRPSKGNAGHTTKLQESLSRSKRVVYELALCNPWEYFVTLTIDGQKYDRYNLKFFFTVLSKWLNNLNYQKSLNIKYLLIPEPHKDNAWHFHGLMMGIPQEQLQCFTLEDNIPLRLKRLIEQGRTIMDWLPYCEKFGWITVEAIRDKASCAKYITKYITKQLLESRIELNHHVYYASQNLRRAETICRAPILYPFEPDYQNDYVRVKHFTNAPEALQYFIAKEDAQ